MKDEGAAGGGCEYCRGRSVTALYLDKAEGCYAFVDGPKLNICNHGAGMTVPIRVCPMCGRPLERKQAEDWNRRDGGQGAD